MHLPGKGCFFLFVCFLIILRNIDLFTGFWAGVFPKKIHVYQPKARKVGCRKTLALSHARLTLLSVCTLPIKLFSSQSSGAAANCWLLIVRVAAAQNVSNSTFLPVLDWLHVLFQPSHDSQEQTSLHLGDIKGDTFEGAVGLLCHHLF